MTVVYSWVIPIKDEKNSINTLFNKIQKVMGKKSYEIIAINDASKDGSKELLNKLAPKISNLKVIHLPTHQGKWAALQTGFKTASGSIIITLDSDLQDDPEEFPKLLNKLNQGYDLVSGWRKIRYDPFYKVWISKIGNFLASTLV